MALLKIWDEQSKKWIAINAPLPNSFGTVKIGEVFLDADGPADTLNITEGDNVKLLPNQDFDSVVISVPNLGDLTQLTTLNTDNLVAAINELKAGQKTYTAIIGRFIAEEKTNTFELPIEYDQSTDRVTMTYKGFFIYQDIEYSITDKTVMLGFELTADEFIEYTIFKNAQIIPSMHNQSIAVDGGTF